MLSVTTEGGRKRAVEQVEVRLDVMRGAYWCTWCDQHVDTKGRLRHGEVCCEDSTPVLYDEVVVIETRALVSFRPALWPEDRELLGVDAFVDGEEFTLTQNEKDEAAALASEEWS